jgi:hypothetical protein
MANARAGLFPSPALFPRGKWARLAAKERLTTVIAKLNLRLKAKRNRQGKIKVCVPRHAGSLMAQGFSRRHGFLSVSTIFAKPHNHAGFRGTLVQQCPGRDHFSTQLLGNFSCPITRPMRRDMCADGALTAPSIGLWTRVNDGFSGVAGERSRKVPSGQIGVRPEHDIFAPRPLWIGRSVAKFLDTLHPNSLRMHLDHLRRAPVDQRVSSNGRIEPPKRRHLISRPRISVRQGKAHSPALTRIVQCEQHSRFERRSRPPGR